MVVNSKLLEPMVLVTERPSHRGRVAKFENQVRIMFRVTQIAVYVSCLSAVIVFVTLVYELGRESSSVARAVTALWGDTARRCSRRLIPRRRRAQAHRGACASESSGIERGDDEPPHGDVTCTLPAAAACCPVCASPIMLGSITEVPPARCGMTCYGESGIIASG